MRGSAPVQHGAEPPGDDAGRPRAESGPARRGLLSAAGPGLATAAAGTQLALAALLASRPDTATEALSAWGIRHFRAEREVRMFLIGVGVALVLALLTATRGRRQEAHGARSGVTAAAVAAVGMAVFVACYLKALSEIRLSGPTPGWFWPLTGALTAISAGAALTGGTGAAGPRDPWAPPTFARGKPSVFDVGVPVAVAVLLYVPSWRSVAGSVFLQDALLLHWDYFAMGPALAFEHGASLGTDYHPNYGAGWPLLFAAIADLAPLGYGRMIQIGSIYTCLYLAGVYLLLRVLVRRPAVAAAGTLLAVLPFFFWTYGLSLWLAPAVTPLRNPFDVWCFAALAMHHRTGGRRWAVAAGALCGLEIVFHVQAGLILAAALAFYWLCLAGTESTPQGRGTNLTAVSMSAAALLAVVIAGAAMAGRGTIVSGGFLLGWVDEPLDFLTIPITAAPGGTVIAFASLVFFYLAVVAVSLRRLVQRRGSHQDVFPAALAFYGLVMLTKFVHYSAATILPRLVTPAAITLAILVCGGLDANRASRGTRPGLTPLLGVASLACLLMLAAATSGTGLRKSLGGYPNLFNRPRGGEGLCLLERPRDLCGLPQELQPAGSAVRQVTGVLDELKREGVRFAVLDESGSLFYLLTDTAPFGRTSRIFTSAYTTEQLEEAARLLEDRFPDAVLTRRPITEAAAEPAAWAYLGAGPVPASPYLDTWNALRSVVSRHYRPEAVIGPYELWRRSSREGASGPRSGSLPAGATPDPPAAPASLRF